MKICFLAAASLIHAVRWVNAFAEKEHEVHLITMHAEKLDKINPNVHVHQLTIPAPVGYYVNFIEAKQRLKKIDPDIVHIHYASGYGTLGRLVDHHPSILSVWGTDVFIFPELNQRNNKILRKNLQSADQITSTSYAMKEVTKQYITPTVPIEVIPFGIDVNKFSPNNVQTNRESIVIGTVKRLEDVYGIDTLIKVTAKVVEQLHLKNQSDIAEQLKLKIIGDGSQKESLRQLAANLNIDHLTEFIGDIPHEKVPDYLNQLDVYCAFSRSESFGVAVLEASACEVPVVVSDVGGLAEVVQHGKTGFIISENNMEEMAIKLVELILEKELRDQMGRNGRSFVEEYYNWNINVNQMEQVYEKVVKRHQEYEYSKD